MRKVLIIKTSSLGDVIHTLPALTDAKTVLGDVQFDWVVEENFAEIPRWHPAVTKVFTVSIRRWRKQILRSIFSGEWKNFKQQLQQQQYDLVIDAQGLLKSAWLSRYAQGAVYGLDKNSAREPMAARFYQFPQTIAKQQHAVERIRELFAKSLGYSLQGLPLDYGIAECISAQHGHALQNKTNVASKQVMFFHGTTWKTKHWPEQYWFELADNVTEQGCQLLIPWGNELEYQRALRIQQKCAQQQQVRVLDKMGLNELVKQVNAVDVVVAVDTGLAHLSAALGKPTVALYGPTSPGLTGTYGNNQLHLKADSECSPCFKKNCNKIKGNITPECFSTVTPEMVMNAMNDLLTMDNSKEQLV